MLIQTTIRISFAAVAATLASGIGAASQAHAHSSCTPQHLVSALQQVEAQCGAARIVSDHRPGARIRGSRHASQHSFCNGTNGAIDAVFANRACALSALRKTNYTILTYGRSGHIHIGTDGWSTGGTQVARHRQTRVRMAARSQRAANRAASRRVARARTEDAQWQGQGQGSGDWSGSGSDGRSGTGFDAGWASARAESGPRSGRRAARSQRAYASATQGRGYTRVASRQGWREGSRGSQSGGDWNASW